MAIRTENLGGTDWVDGNVLTAEDLVDTIDANTKTAMSGMAQVPYTTLKSTGTWENEGNLAADRFTVVAGVNGTVNTGDNTAIFNNNKYIIAPYYIEINAISLTGNWNINDCILKQVNSNTWRLFVKTTDSEIARAKLYNTLFDAVNGRLKGTTYATGVTVIKTPFNDDVGKYGFAYTYTSTTPFFSSGGYCRINTVLTGTFTNTANNTNVSAWSYVYSKRSRTSQITNDYTRFEMPVGTVINTVTAPSTTSATISDERFIDTSADNITNPATFRIETQPCKNESGSPTYTSIASVVILSKGSINTADITKDVDTTITEYLNINYNVDYSIPFMTAFDSYQFYSEVISDTNILNFTGDEKLISIYNSATTPSDTSMKIQLSDETKTISEVHTLSANQTTLIPITVPPTADNDLKMTFILETTDTTKTPELYGYGVYKA